jgi:hypothetical protein
MDEFPSPNSPDDPSPPKMLGAWILILVLLVSASISTSAAVLEAPSWPSLLWAVALLAVALTGILVIGHSLLRECSLAVEDSRRAKRPQRLRSRSPNEPSHPPFPFRQRLAAFLQVPKGEVLVPRPRPVSSMPFWSSVPLSPRPIMNKSVEFIRAVLERIHAAVRG